MYKNITSLTLFTLAVILLTGCITPVSSGCANNQEFKSQSTDSSSNNQNCSEIDAAIYLASALYMEAQKEPTKEKTISDPNANDSKCSGLVGKAQKECQRKVKASYDPLEEL